MKNTLKNLLVAIPFFLYLIAANQNFVMDPTGLHPMFDSSLLDYDAQFGSIANPMFTFIIFGVLAIFFYSYTNNEILKNLGKALYVVTLLHGYNIFTIMSHYYGLNAAGNTLKMAFGGVLMVMSLIMGLIVLLFMLAVPFISDTYGFIYDSTVKSPAAFNNIYIKELKTWKGLVEEKIITEEEYELMKSETLNKIKVKKKEILLYLRNMKLMEKEGFISERDFIEEKAKYLGN